MEEAVSMRFYRDQFWDSSKNEVFLPAHSSFSVTEIDVALQELGIGEALVFQSSGTTGDARFVCHTRAGLLASAAAVCAHLEVCEGDTWLNVLPVFHVGGFGVYARAYHSSSNACDLSMPWSATLYAEQCSELGASLSALVPTQIYDLVNARSAAPDSLRAVLVGGGYLDPALEDQARELGWPIVRTYGLSEAGSQVATQRDEELLILPHLEVSIGHGGRLRLRGESMFTGYLCKDAQGAWEFDEARGANGWFQSDDLVELDGDVLRFIGRSSSRVKVLGELVDVDAIERSLLKRAHGVVDIAVVDVPDPRSQNALVVAFTETEERAQLEAIIQAFNREIAGFERITRATRVAAIPRSNLGKIRRDELRKRVIDAEK